MFWSKIFAYFANEKNGYHDIIVFVFEFYRTYPLITPTYIVSEEEPVVESSSQLGGSLPITVMFANSGPSSLPNVSLVILLPLRNATDTGDYYYLYALDVNVSSGCNASWLYS